jgi:hypothetical protein
MTLYSAVKRATGQDLYLCKGCNDCDIGSYEDMDIPLSSLVQLVIMNDEEALDCRTLWSDTALESARGSCKRGLNLPAVMLALRDEAARKAGNV